MSEQSEQDDREALIAEAKAAGLEKYPPNHLVDDPEGETGYAESDPYGYDETARNAFVEGVEWALARRSPEPQQVSTVEGLEALPVNSVLRGERMAGDLRHFIAERIHNFRDPDALWSIDGQHYYTHEVAFNVICPATVLYRPEGGEQ